MIDSYTQRRLLHLAELGFKPKRILDIGAYHGEWTEMIKSVFPKAKIFMIEANPDHEDILSDIDQAEGFEIILLGDKKRKKVDYYIANPGTMTSGNSIFHEQTTFFKDARTKPMPMTTLDALVVKNKLKDINFIKLDTQGSELDILNGGQKTLRGVEFVLLETQALEFNKKAPMAIDVINVMDRYGYTLYDIVELHYLPTGEMYQVDFLFARKNSKFRRKGLLC